MSSVIVQIIVVYGAFTVLAFTAGAALAMTRSETETTRRTAARVALSAPLWPVWLVFGLGWLVVKNVRYLIRIAR